MTNRDHTRRTVLQAAGATSVAVLAAGCLSGDDDGNGNGNGNDDGGNGGVDPEEWEDVDEIELEGDMSGWTGVAPEMIDGEDDPTIVLFEGQEYDFTWTNADGDRHNIEIWDEDEELVDDEYGTDLMEEEGESQTLEGVAASDDMAYYRCRPHNSMQGEIRVESE